MASSDHYTVGYKDDRQQRIEVCTYARDAYEARTVIMEDVPFVHDHPNSISYILFSR